MTYLSGATVKEFKNALEVMRSVYPFKDEETRIVSDMNPCAQAHNSLEITTVDKTGVRVNLMCDVKEVNDGRD